MTRPATTTSPSPQLASIRRSSAPVDRVLGEHHARPTSGSSSDCTTTPMLGRVEEADALAVRDRRVGVRRPPDLARARRRGRRAERHVEQREVLARRSWRRRRPRRRPTTAPRAASGSVADQLHDPFERVGVAGDDRRRRSSPESATPGGIGRPARVASPSPTALAPKSDSSCASASGTTVLTRAPSLHPRRRRRARACRRR